MQENNGKQPQSIHKPKTAKGNGTIDEQFYDNSDLKRILNISDSTLYRMRRDGELPFTKQRGKFYYPKSYFNKTILEKCMQRLTKSID